MVHVKGDFVSIEDPGSSGAIQMELIHTGSTDPVITKLLHNSTVGAVGYSNKSSFM
jgi:hypothetical protein